MRPSLILFLVLSLGACGEQAYEEEEKKEGDETTQPEQVQPAVEPPPELVQPSSPPEVELHTLTFRVQKGGRVTTLARQFEGREGVYRAKEPWVVEVLDKPRAVLITQALNLEVSFGEVGHHVELASAQGPNGFEFELNPGQGDLILKLTDEKGVLREFRQPIYPRPKLHWQVQEVLPTQNFGVGQGWDVVGLIEVSHDHDLDLELKWDGSAGVTMDLPFKDHQPNAKQCAYFPRVDEGSEVIRGGFKLVPQTFYEPTSQVFSSESLSLILPQGQSRVFWVLAKGRGAQVAQWGFPKDMRQTKRNIVQSCINGTTTPEVRVTFEQGKVYSRPNLDLGGIQVSTSYVF